MPLLDELDQIEASLASTADALAHQQTQALLAWLTAKPDALFGELRRRRPILSVGRYTIVTLYDDVREVLGQDEIFSVRIYRPKLERTSGPVLLEMPVGAAREHDLAALALGIRREDLGAIRRWAGEVAAELIEAALPDRKIDVVSQLCHRVPVRVLTRYYGLTGADEATVMRWARDLFEDIFANLRDDPTERDAAVRSAGEFRSYLDGLIAKRQADLTTGQPGADDVLGRLLAAQSDPASPATFDDVAIRNNLLGLTLAGVDTIYTAMVHVIAELLARPEHLHGARRAALSGDDDLLDQYAREALRFRPEDPLLYRYCETPYTLARGTDRETSVAPGALVIVANVSAMHDPSRIEAPEEFRLDRPDDDYMHFGFGLHQCFGRYIARAQIGAVTGQILRLRDLRPAAGSAGQVQYDGIYPRSLVVEFAGIDSPVAG
jgi:cytochrome P450